VGALVAAPVAVVLADEWEACAVCLDAMRCYSEPGASEQVPPSRTGRTNAAPGVARREARGAPPAVLSITRAARP